MDVLVGTVGQRGVRTVGCGAGFRHHPAWHWSTRATPPSPPARCGGGPGVSFQPCCAGPGSHGARYLNSKSEVPSTVARRETTSKRRASPANRDTNSPAVAPASDAGGVQSPSQLTGPPGPMVRKAPMLAGPLDRYGKKLSRTQRRVRRGGFGLAPRGGEIHIRGARQPCGDFVRVHSTRPAHGTGLVSVTKPPEMRVARKSPTAFHHARPQRGGGHPTSSGCAAAVTNRTFGVEVGDGGPAGRGTLRDQTDFGAGHPLVAAERFAP